MNSPNEDNVEQDELWLTQAKQQLSRPLPPSVAGQLRAARRTVLSEASASQQSPSVLKSIMQWGVPAFAGVASIALTIYLLSPAVTNNQKHERPDLQTAGSITTEDLSILKAQDDLEFYQDLEFLLWMEQAANGNYQG